VTYEHAAEPNSEAAMAKSKSGKKLKIPKRIGGVKVPKAARKGPVADFLNSSGGQVLLAEALVLAAGVFGINQLRSTSGRNGADARGTIEEASARLAHACSEALKAFRAALAEDPPAAEDAIADSDLAQAETEVEALEKEKPSVKKKTRDSATARATH
jgi:hypothetical protein